MRALIILVLVLFASPALAEDLGPPDNLKVIQLDKPCEQWCKPYWKSMPKTEYVYDVLVFADMLTTLDIKNHPAVGNDPGLIERNPILGPHPSDAKIIALCAASVLLHSMVTYELVDRDAPKVLIRTWEITTIAFEGGYGVAHNLRIGLRFKF